MRIKPQGLLFAALMVPAMITPAVSAQDADADKSLPTAMKGTDVINKSAQDVKDFGWELGIEMQNPRQIHIPQRDGSTKSYWYIIYKVVNANTTRPAVLVPDRDSEEENAIKPGIGEGELKGLPISTNLSFYVETVNGMNALKEPAAIANINDLREKLRKEVSAENSPIGKAGDEETGEISERDAAIADARYRDAYGVHGNANNHFVLNQIATKEGLNYYNPMTKQMEVALHPLSAFQSHFGYIYDFENDGEDYYSGVKAVPYEKKMPTSVDVEKFSVGKLFPGVEDGSFLKRWYTIDELEGKTPSNGEVNINGVRVVVNHKSPLFGRLLKTKYKEGDVVDTTGRVLTSDMPGYQQAAASFGYRQSAGEAIQCAKVRVYKEGDRILNQFDTEIEREEGKGTYVINGKVVGYGGTYGEEIAKLQRDFAKALSRGPDAEDRVNHHVGRKSDSIASSVVAIDSSTSNFGRDLIGQPIKVLDRLGRAVTKELVLYSVGDYVSKDEYDIWAVRKGESVSYAKSGLANRPLQEGDFLINAPKIRMGQKMAGENFAAESIERFIPAAETHGRKGDQVLKNFSTGRRYSPKDVAPEKFLRDADGTFFTFRTAPIEGADADSSATTHYQYAPLGRANKDALPVPSFDDQGVWADWVDPITNRPIPLRDADGRKIRDRLGVVQNLKAYSYEWRYAYQLQPVKDSEAASRDRSDASFRVASKFVDSDKTFAAWVDSSDNFAHIALRTAYAEKADPNDATKYLRVPLTRVLGPEQFSQSTYEAYLKNFDLTETLAGYTLAFTQPGQIIEGNMLVMEKRAGLSVKADFKFQKYYYDTIVAQYGSQNVGVGPGVKSTTYKADSKYFEATNVVASGFDAGESHSLFKTWERFTLPAPEIEDGKPKTRNIVQLASGLNADNSDAIFGTKNLISERYGVLILDNVDDGWDYLNISVRGLRSPFNNRKIERQENGSFAIKPEAQDWVYNVRYAKPGDEFDVERDLIRRERGQWFLLNE